MIRKLKSVVSGLLVAMVAAVAPQAASAAVYDVPANDVIALTNAFAKAAGNGAVIRISAGVYDLKGIVMTSDSHLALPSTSNPVGRKILGMGKTPEDTVIIGGGSADNCRVLQVCGYSTVVSNLTITGGYATSGGGGISGNLSWSNWNPTIIDCIVTNNYANGGGGIYYGTAKNCLIANNTSSGYGGGVYAVPTTDCVISNNVMTKNDPNLGGGGAYGDCNHTRTKFYYNRAPNSVGGAVCGTSTLTDCILIGNSANSGQLKGTVTCKNCFISGGSVPVGATSYTDTTIIGMTGSTYVLNGGTCQRCVISNCVMTSGNGSFFTSATFKNCLLADLRNTGASNGGYVGRVACSCKLYNCTLTGFWRQYSNYGTIDSASVCVNSIVAGNSPQDFTSGDTPTMTNSFWAVGSPSSAKYTGGGKTTIAKLQFTDKPNGDYTIGRKSVARNAGWSDAAYLSLVGAKDLKGDDRVSKKDLKGAKIDVGAYEFSQPSPGLAILLR